MIPTNRIKVPLIRYIFLLILFVYLAFLYYSHPNIFQNSGSEYYSYLLDALLHGRVNIMPSYMVYDLSFFQGKWYLYWGPGPVLFVLPFYLLYTLIGFRSGDVLYTAIGGIANCIIFYYVLRQFKKYFILKSSFFSDIFLLLSFAFASPNFYLSLTGSVWSTEHVVATLYFLLFLFFYFLFLNNNKRMLFLFASVVFFNLAWLSRYTMIFSSILFLLPIFYSRPNDKKRSIIQAVIVGTVFLSFASLLLFYNYLKFNNPFETGMRYQEGAQKYDSILKSGKLLSFSYVSHNFHHYFFAFPQFSSQPPFIKIDPEGNSIFFMYPCTLFLLLLFKRIRYFRKELRIFTILTGVILIASYTFFLCFFSTGWFQLGSRFFLDIAPLVFLAIVAVLTSIPIYVLLPVLFYETTINLLGVLNFFKLIS